MMQCPQCNRQLEEDATFCGFCGTQIAPLHARGATMRSSDDATILAPSSNGIPPKEQLDTVPNTPGMVNRGFSAWQAPSPHSSLQTVQAQPDTPEPLTPPIPPSRSPGRNRSRILFASRRNRILIILLVLIIIAGGTIAGALALKNAITPATSGNITFFDSQGSATGDTDAMDIMISNLAAPPSGSQYNAWLISDRSEQIIAPGTLVQQGQNYTLRYNGDGSRRHQGTNLLGAGNKIEITQEQGAVAVPTGKVVLIGTFPPLAFVHIRHLLYQFPTTPGHIGLLVGLLEQARLLNEQAQLMQHTGPGNNTAIRCIAQSIIDIVEGDHGSHFQSVGGNCGNIATGDGFGLLGNNNGYLLTAAQHASLAANQADSTDTIREFAGQVEVATTNITGWATSIDLDALNIISNPNDNTSIANIVKLANQVYNGVDINGDGHVDPVAGEAGAITAYLQGQLMAQLPLIVPV
ncbi:MAG TPA: zinc ribbon domain-containing protein [Ktedonobacteraceae bacterium]|nr:zinc ribbon domain-containing protein [Ktedonobacteraceae bacterium]